MSNSIKVLAEEHPTYFLCSHRDIPSLVAKAEAEAEQILKEFSMFYKTTGDLTIKIEPVQFVCGFGIGGKLLWGGTPILEENDCGLLFLHLNEIMLNRMIQLGVPSFGQKKEDLNE